MWSRFKIFPPIEKAFLSIPRKTCLTFTAGNPCWIWTRKISGPWYYSSGIYRSIRDSKCCRVFRYIGYFALIICSVRHFGGPFDGKRPFRLIKREQAHMDLFDGNVLWEEKFFVSSKKDSISAKKSFSIFAEDNSLLFNILRWVIRKTLWLGKNHKTNHAICSSLWELL